MYAMLVDEIVPFVAIVGTFTVKPVTKTLCIHHTDPFPHPVFVCKSTFFVKCNFFSHFQKVVKSGNLISTLHCQYLIPNSDLKFDPEIFCCLFITLIWLAHCRRMVCRWVINLLI
jgi:hypothetical protein